MMSKLTELFDKCPVNYCKNWTVNSEITRARNIFYTKFVTRTALIGFGQRDCEEWGLPTHKCVPRSAKEVDFADPAPSKSFERSNDVWSRGQRVGGNERVPTGLGPASGDYISKQKGPRANPEGYYLFYKMTFL